MKEIYKDYLFEKHILVSEGMTEEKQVFETLFAMTHFFLRKNYKGQGACTLRNGKRTLKEIRRKCSGTILQRISTECPRSFYGRTIV